MKIIYFCLLEQFLVADVIFPRDVQDIGRKTSAKYFNEACKFMPDCLSHLPFLYPELGLQTAKLHVVCGTLCFV